MLEEKLNIVEKELRKIFQNESTGHDIYHLIRTKNVALKIQEVEGGDREVIGISAILHDIHRIMSKQTKKFVHPRDSLVKVGEFLDLIDISEEQRNKILHSIENHEEYGFSGQERVANDKETLILQDADNIDAIGAIGIGRTFSYGGAHNLNMWLPDIGFEREVYDESIEDPSIVHHFYSKLLKLKDNMNTEIGRQMAEHRHKFMEQYLDEFFGEWKGIK